MVTRAIERGPEPEPIAMPFSYGLNISVYFFLFFKKRLVHKSYINLN